VWALRSKVGSGIPGRHGYRRQRCCPERGNPSPAYDDAGGALHEFRCSGHVDDPTIAGPRSFLNCFRLPSQPKAAVGRGWLRPRYPHRRKPRKLGAPRSRSAPPCPSNPTTGSAAWRPNTA
jgi:hypothetical protein